MPYFYITTGQVGKWLLKTVAQTVVHHLP